MNNYVTVLDSKMFLWEPKPDITIYELALCIPFFTMRGHIEAAYNGLPDQAKRHFRIPAVDHKVEIDYDGRLSEQ